MKSPTTATPTIQFSACRLRLARPIRQHEAPALRGFFGREFEEEIFMHNHNPDGGVIYQYPRVQYRIANGVPQLIGIVEGTAAVKEAVKNLESLRLNSDTYNVNFVDMTVGEFELAETDEKIEYRFASPWLALSQKNHKTYVDSSQRGQQELLKRILIGNLLSMCKSFDVIVTEHLRCELFVRAKPVYVKRQRMLGFVGQFKVNFEIPHTIGLGHLVSIGFGDVRRNQRRVGLINNEWNRNTHA